MGGRRGIHVFEGGDENVAERNDLEDGLAVVRGVQVVQATEGRDFIHFRVGGA